jgi:hypothetical protein
VCTPYGLRTRESLLAGTPNSVVPPRGTARDRPVDTPVVSALAAGTPNSVVPPCGTARDRPVDTPVLSALTAGTRNSVVPPRGTARARPSVPLARGESVTEFLDGPTMVRDGAAPTREAPGARLV